MKNNKLVVVLIIISSIICFISGFLIYSCTSLNTNISVILSNSKLKKLGYSKSSIELINEYGLSSKVSKNKYSKTLDMALKNKLFIKNNLELYYNVNYINDKNFINNLNKLSKLGYNIDEINVILNNIKYDDISVYLNIDNVNVRSVIDYVNVNSEKIPYIDYNVVNNPDNTLVLVNKYNKLADDYKPNDLMRINTNYSVKNLYLRKEAKNAFEAMCRDASALGLNIRAISAYRTFEYQKDLYDNYVKNSGIEKADTYSARPGFSEHETGLALDIMGSNKDYTRFEKTNEYTWIFNNAHNYGFIIRYPLNKEDVTKYKFESWHIRYVGIGHSKYIHENNLCLEEYIVLNKE